MLKILSADMQISSAGTWKPVGVIIMKYFITSSSSMLALQFSKGYNL